MISCGLITVCKMRHYNIASAYCKDLKPQAPVKKYVLNNFKAQISEEKKTQPSA